MKKIARLLNSIQPLNLKFHQPNKKLKKYIQCYWSLDVMTEKNKTITQKIISDGSNGVIFNLASAVDIMVDTHLNKNLNDILITGATLKPTYLTIRDRTKLIGVRFNIGGSYPFFEQSLNGYSDRVVGFEDEAWQGVLERLQHESITGVLDEFLLERLIPHKLEQTDWMLEVIALLFKYPVISKDELCTQLSVSHRQLERKFKELVGLSVKQIQSIIKLHNSRESIKENAFSTLTEVGYESHYYDQSHFIKEFKKLTDTTPKKYHQEKMS